ncbi:hypothetical protein [Mesorhizobium sp. 1B3]|uniref:hypothetical protein n=1 Tax=Mesorhizobium sp. 1B3 TaxID=3243599 RepID=UPI003D98D351
MVTPRLLLTALVCFSAQASARAGDILPTHPKEPSAIIFERNDYGGRNSIAKAKVTRESAVDWCGNWKPSDPAEACADEILDSEAGRVYEASANCHSGELTSIFGDRYIYNGLWRNTGDGMWDGWAKFKDTKSGETVGTSNAAGGIALAAQWRALCPYGAPFDMQPLRMVVTAAEHSEYGEIAGHNGSTMRIDYGMGTITYIHPKESLEGIVPYDALLFRGAIIMNGPVEGMAFTFKKGCEPASYHVEGYFPTDSDKLVLTGKAPVREGCKVVGYSEKSPNARLVFDLPYH